IFLVNVPIGIAAVILGLKVIPRVRKSDEKNRMDWTGAATSFLALALFVFAVHSGHRLEWNSPVIIGCFAASAVFAFLFVVNERRSEHPLVHPGLFSNRNYTLAALALIPSFMTTSGILFIFPLFLEIARHLSAQTSGLMLISLAAGQLAGPYVGHLSDRFGARRILLAGMSGSVVSFIWMITLGTESPAPVILASLFFAGLVMGFEKAPNVQLAISQVPVKNRGVAGGTLGVFRSVGILMGLLFFERIFSLSIHAGSTLAPHQMTLNAIDPSMAATGFRAVMIFGLSMRLVAIALILSMKGRRDSR
ncbi:MAG: MFS transporter, partial [Candidatus Fermentibacteria bacterium]|nr:MFS transporter [Candidatus Fermentibacteria bacterium]